MKSTSLILCAVAITGAIAGCTPTGGAGPVSSRLASNSSLSVEAIHLQSASEKLLTLEQQQVAARDRERSFAVQGTLVGGVLGAGLGAGLACGIEALRGRECSDGEMIAGGVGGAAVGGKIGYDKGTQVARDQNAAADRENEIRRRLQVAGEQLSTARTARISAEKVAAQNIARLRQMQAAVAAGTASKEQLMMARADASADAQQIHAAAAAMGSGAGSLASSSKATAAQSPSQAGSLQNAQHTMTAEQSKTAAQYNVLIEAINNSAL
ncbi:hypothetical protein HNP73_002763 [Amaricoccus macauensis]|uniref:Glycine zipper domain-containing protein n=1 Tax=Amaricoccus macauensis TaxID=57001 RepID=A0A840SLJ0_9RHOB|nr:hypothetical protein [Amaricoccus macauensis]MBB5222827.1 hypothetical protein [Amaricoccus macauensis]